MNAHTIQNCWKTTKILPDLGGQDLEEPSNGPDHTAEIASLINKLPLGTDALTAEEFIELPDNEEIEQELTDEQLIQAVSTKVSLPI